MTNLQHSLKATTGMDIKEIIENLSGSKNS